MKQTIDTIEFQELALEIIDMLGVALHFAGVKTENIPQAIDAYLEEIDTIDGEQTYGQKEIIAVIEGLRTKKGFLFS
ncbi:hypothetical protein BKH46_04685 [Helicobacter sp. 12S02634-8]|uniref:hypothetical protein n=1 Tax=Helicobacter sp. 12S02634-8 TaxID=1476199 RepID=UPI000BA5E537|nr:hypothetical protein [Helicobacter sp. 12S02634-8]PAF47379.1 hypothetical protein BKH46_04685 [Helicobacter sp. 12S02634-8]